MDSINPDRSMLSVLEDIGWVAELCCVLFELDMSDDPIVSEPEYAEEEFEEIEVRWWGLIPGV